MCGIIGYIGAGDVCRIIVSGLKRLEYRGYDSMGVAIGNGGTIEVRKGAGRIDDLVNRFHMLDLKGDRGVGHVRWATHGSPNDTNAHPQLDCTGKIAVVHNGIIENFDELKRMLEARGHVFRSQTDTEVVAHLIEEELKKHADFEAAFRSALRELRGSFALGVVYADDAESLYFARMESPLVLGVGDHGMFAASDVPAFLEHTRRVVLMDDGEYAILRRNSWEVKEIESGRTVPKEVHEVSWTLEMAEKGGYPHFMLKEIYEQPEAIAATLAGSLKRIGEFADMLYNHDKVILVGMGTSFHSALFGKYILQRVLGITPIVEEASEFRYLYDGVLDDDTLVVAITQSGETADTLAAIKLAKRSGSKVLSIVNVVGSMATRLSDGVIYTHAGPEIGVAATKTYTSQLAVLAALAFTANDDRDGINDLRKVPEKIRETLNVRDRVAELADVVRDKRGFFYISRGVNVPTAMEGALKLKEISYVYAEGLSAGELKHGPLAVVEEGTPVIAIAPADDLYKKTLMNVEEAKARGAFTVLLSDEHGDGDAADFQIDMPEMNPLLTPMVYAVPLQLLAYELAVRLGRDPDKPRNLAKSVTVE
ncbi:MAG: glutamine--fructose-6-phosphate transaminase (isomerizing) [Thermococci archaeon]|nr:glutamine--fructose-6-phosphate transaminase (isomerizing) [Thermococci archaeon]